MEMEKLRAVKEYDNHQDLTIVVGGKEPIPEGIPDDKLILYGNCTKHWKKEHPDALWVAGCPAGETALLNAICFHRACNDAEPETVSFVRGEMDRTQPIWREYVDKKAKEFYANA
jgi:hypothetical protein